MRIGISICSNYRLEDPRLGARYMVERAATARQADLDSLFVGDHHVTPTNYYQNTAILGRMLAEWGNKPAGALYLLPLWHPVLLAEQIGTLAAIMGGRFILQCALGGDRKQSAGMGVDLKKRVPMFEDSLSIMQALWRGESVSHNRFWPIENASINPRPADPVEVWVGSSAPAAINRTARMAQGWLASPALGLQQATEQLNQYQQACAGHDCTPSAVAVRRDIYIGETSQAAAKMKQDLLARGYRGFPEEALVAGSAMEVADELARFGGVGYTDIIVRNMSQDQGEALATIERLAEVKKLLA
ncbi:MAG: LLM class flavin-dependent oxidoreductase [Pseudomonadaceae bacterium]|nr:LLM class flavin-dependent oxidoreductase [Pseudomonadaceae bacterium]